MTAPLSRSAPHLGQWPPDVVELGDRLRRLEAAALAARVTGDRHQADALAPIVSKACRDLEAALTRTMAADGLVSETRGATMDDDELRRMVQRHEQLLKVVLEHFELTKKLFEGIDIMMDDDALKRMFQRHNQMADAVSAHFEVTKKLVEATEMTTKAIEQLGEQFTAVQEMFVDRLARRISEEFSRSGLRVIESIQGEGEKE